MKREDIIKKIEDLIDSVYFNDEEWSKKTLEEIFVAGAEFALKDIRRMLNAELTNIPDSEGYVDPDWYAGEIDSMVEYIDKLLCKEK